MRSNNNVLGMVGFFLSGGAALALGCGSLPETAPDGDELEDASEAEAVREVEQKVCQQSYDPVVADARALIAANCGGISACGGIDTALHSDIQLQNGSYCDCYSYMWSNRSSYPWNSLQVFYHEPGACSWPHIHLEKKNKCGLFHFDLDEGYDAASGLPGDGDCEDDEPSHLIDKAFCSSGSLKGACDDVAQPTCSNAVLPMPSDRWRLRITNSAAPDTPVEIRYDAVGSNGFTFDWGAGSPSACVGGENFGVVFARSAYFATAGTYTFTTTTDDGVKLLVDDVVISNHWYDQAKVTRSVQHYVSAGWHTVKMKYYEHQGWAYAALSWTLTGP